MIEVGFIGPDATLAVDRTQLDESGVEVILSMERALMSRSSALSLHTPS
jgi:hypothetical protein